MSPRLRYARQYTLAEIGTTGQSRLEAASVRAGEGDPRAMEIALTYLERASVGRSEHGEPVRVVGSEEVSRIAGRPELVNAAAFLVGSLAATEHIVRIVGVQARGVAHVPTLSGESDDRP